MRQDFNRLITWSKQFNYLPWRKKRSLYRTLVSEIMLQQTTVATVLNKFEDFLKKYPSLAVLAKATEEEILIAWKGLGYYRRAKNLLAAAKYITAKYGAEIPKDYYQLVSIPGIGDYTANAILAIGNEQRALAIDTNIERVLARYYGLDLEKGLQLKKTILKLFENKEILDFNLSFRAVNEGLMDLGREYCTSTKAHCNSCPLHTGCKSKENPLVRPVIKKKQRITYDLSLLRVLIIEHDHLMCYQKSGDEWLTGQWECPTFIVSSSCDKIKQYPFVLFAHEHLKAFKTTITKYKISNYILKITQQDFYNLFCWDRALHKVAISHNSNLSTATQKALAIVL